MRLVIQDAAPGELEVHADRLIRVIRQMAGDGVPPDEPVPFIKARPAPPHFDQEARKMDLPVLQSTVERARQRHVARIQKRMLELMLDAIEG